MGKRKHKSVASMSSFTAEAGAMAGSKPERTYLLCAATVRCRTKQGGSRSVFILGRWGWMMTSEISYSIWSVDLCIIFVILADLVPREG